MMERFTEHRSSISKLLSAVLEKAPYFAADIVEGSLQNSMFPTLGLPAAFVEHHRKNLTEKIILEGPDGHKWPVMFGYYWNSEPCILQGWGEFATDCNLAVNDQVLFFLRKDSHFLVQVFDSNHNIKRTGGGTSARIARTTLPQVTDPIESFGFKTTTPNIPSLPSTNNNNGDFAKNVPKENRTTQASPSDEKLGNQEPGVEEDDDRVSDFNAKSGEMVESFPSAPPSDAEEDQAWSMERARNLNRNTTLLGVDEPYDSALEPPGSTLKINDYVIKVAASVQETDGAKNAKRSVSGATSHGKFCKEKLSSSSSYSSANEQNSLAPQSGDGEGMDSEQPNGDSELVFRLKRSSKTRLQGVGIRMSDLSASFHLSLVNAAKKLRVSPVTLKKACRDFGLKRWPGRKVRSLQSSIQALQRAIAVGQGGGLGKSNEAYMRSKVLKLQQEMDQLVHGTPAQINQKMQSRVVRTLYN